VLHLDIFPTCRVAQGRLALAWRDRARSPADYHAHYHQGSQGRFRISALYKQGRLRCCIFTTLSPIAPPPLYGVEPSRRRANPDVIPWKQYQFYQAKHIHGCSKAGGLSSYCDRVVSHLKPVLTQALTLVCSALVAHWEPPGGKRSYCFYLLFSQAWANWLAAFHISVSKLTRLVKGDAPCGIRTLITDLEVAEGAFRKKIPFLIYRPN